MWIHEVNMIRERKQRISLPMILYFFGSLIQFDSKYFTSSLCMCYCLLLLQKKRNLRFFLRITISNWFKRYLEPFFCAFQSFSIIIRPSVVSSTFVTTTSHICSRSKVYRNSIIIRMTSVLSYWGLSARWLRRLLCQLSLRICISWRLFQILATHDKTSVALGWWISWGSEKVEMFRLVLTNFWMSQVGQSLRLDRSWSDSVHSAGRWRHNMFGLHDLTSQIISRTLESLTERLTHPFGYVVVCDYLSHKMRQFLVVWFAGMYRMNRVVIRFYWWSGGSLII